MVSTFKLVLLLLFSHVRQRPLRTLLTVIGVALGVSASVAVRTANLDVLRSFEQAVMTVAGPTSLEVSGGELGFDESLISAIRSVPGVRSASPVILQTAVKVGEGQRGLVVQVLGLDLIAEFDQRGFRLSQPESGNHLSPLLDPESIFLGRNIAAEWGLSTGDRVHLQLGPRELACRVAGILEDASTRTSSWDRLAVMDIASAQVNFGMVGRLDRIDLIIDTDRAVEDVRQGVRDVVPPHMVVERPASRTRQVEEMVRAFRLNLTVLSWVGLFVGLFLIYNTLAFAVAQRRREIGIYRAIGMTPAGVAGLFLIEAALLGVLGGMVGSVAGTLLAERMIALVSRTISDLYVPIGVGEGSLFGGSQFWQISLEGVLIGCAVAMIGAIGPSLDASRTVTVRALAPGDYEASRHVRVGMLGRTGLGLLAFAGLLSLIGPVGGVPVFGYLATFCLLAGLSCLAPVCVTGWNWHRESTPHPLPVRQRVIREIAINHAARNPGRNGVTVSALMVGLAIMIGVLIMVRSFRHTVELWINDTVIADIVVAPSIWLRGAEAGSVGRSLPPSWLPILMAIPEVAAVDTYRDVRVDVDGERVALVSRDLRLHAQRSRYLVRRGDSSEQLTHAAETGGILVSEVLANRLGVQEGQSFELTLPKGGAPFLSLPYSMTMRRMAVSWSWIVFCINRSGMMTRSQSFPSIWQQGRRLNKLDVP